MTLAVHDPAPSRTEPDRDCPLCPRLAAFRTTWRQAEPASHNAPVRSFGPCDPRLLGVGLAPGLRPANPTRPRLHAILALGRIAHDTVVTALAEKRAALPFAHGAVHPTRSGPRLYDSYHCSRYNTNTGVLTEAMFRDVFAKVRAQLPALANDAA